ncbi:hypothetical protein ABZ319_04375 [Nocardia sp. NPDC005978]|uniref:hypothetical protein n=1 Tax=Nocardia sp. NPDC005978 TaxID=3156725 RepID=UPI0033A7FB51
MRTTPSSALQLLVQILDRYNSLEEFLGHIRRELDAPTQELPRWSDAAAPAASRTPEAPRLPQVSVAHSTSGRHARRDEPA